MKKYLIAFTIIVLAACTSGETVPDEIELIPLNTEHQFSDVLRDSKTQLKTPVLYFTADWCPPCKAFKKTLKADEMKVVLVSTQLIIVDVDNDPQGMADLYNVNAVPTFIKVGQDSSTIARITSSEWEEDILENIAPVIDLFVNSDKYDRK
ncbi:MAG: hypothetical protein GQ574_29075 [Crocinitomix sp.]|nr:hypothetical protein [Crocinitomix sp.]